MVDHVHPNLLGSNPDFDEEDLTYAREAFIDFLKEDN